MRERKKEKEKKLGKCGGVYQIGEIVDWGREKRSDD